ncbi:DNA repair protein [Nocardioides sp. Root122]|nr:DNA repair protein [Nocardioides sp. Root122]
MPWGRVAEDGTVYVRTADGERSVGSYEAGTPAEALEFFTKRFEELEGKVHLLEQRVASGRLAPEEATASIKSLREQVVDAHAVGDLVSLAGRLDALAPVIATQRAARREERAQKSAESKAEKEKLVAEAERLAEGTDWRNGANRLRELLATWKELPRLDRATDDALWRRFSTARTTYTRHRKAHFAEEHERRDSARVIKERLATEAESLSSSTEWGPTAGRYRDLMREWKAAGPAPREVDDKLWQRFRGAQDTFFGARDAANAALDQEFAANAEVKEQILVEAEALVPVADLEAAKKTFRDLADRWDAAGKVPRDRMKELEGRIRKVEQAIRAVEDEQWSRSDPEKSARADDMIGKLEAGIAETQAKLDKASAAGDDRKVKDLEGELANKQAFLDMAKKAAADFG